MNPTESVSSQYSAVLASGTISALSLWFFNLMPVMIGTTIDQLGWTEQQAGLFASAYLVGSAVLSLTSARWIGRVSWKRWVRMGSLVSGFCFLFISFLDSYIAAMGLIVLAGVGQGMVLAIILAFLGDTPNPTRNFGLTGVISMTLLIPTYLYFPELRLRFGFDGAMGLLAAGAFVSSGLAALVPESGRKLAEVSRTARAHAPVPASIVFVLSARLIFSAGITAIFGSLELVGNASGFDDLQVSRAIMMAIVMGIVGSVLVVGLGSRLPLQVGLFVGLGGVIVATGVAFATGEYWLFFVAAGVFNGAWAFAVAYQLSLIATLDTTGRYTSMVAGMEAIGATFGPLILGFLIFDGHYDGVAAVSLGLIVLSAAFYRIGFKRKNESTVRPSPDSSLHSSE